MFLILLKTFSKTIMKPYFWCDNLYTPIRGGGPFLNARVVIGNYWNKERKQFYAKWHKKNLRVLCNSREDVILNTPNLYTTSLTYLINVLICWFELIKYLYFENVNWFEIKGFNIFVVCWDIKHLAPLSTHFINNIWNM